MITVKPQLMMSPLMVQPGTRVELPCFTRGLPQPRVSWSDVSQSHIPFCSLKENIFSRTLEAREIATVYTELPLQEDFFIVAWQM